VTETETSRRELVSASTLNDFALFGTSSVELRDRAQSKKGMVGSSGTVLIGSTAVVTGDLEAKGNVMLRNQSRVNGNVTTSGTVQKEPGAVITGTVTFAAVPSHPIPVLTLSPGTSDVLVYRGQQKVLAPGRYRNVQVYAGGSLVLAAGQYQVARLFVESSGTPATAARIVCDLGSGTLDFRVASELRIGDSASIELKPGVVADRINLYTAQTSGAAQIGIGAAFNGRLSAPSAEITVASRAHVVGGLYGRRVTVDADSFVEGVQSNRLVAYYPFNGNADDASGNGNTGVVYGASLTGDRLGNPNKAYYFNGTDAYIEVPYAAILDNPAAFTLAAWAKSDVSTYPEEGFIVDMGFGAERRYALSWHYAVGIRGSYCGASAGSFSIDITQWHHYAFTYDGANLIFYVDGVSIAQTPSAVGSIDDFPLRIGTQSKYPERNWQGTIDEVRMYNNALSASEVAALTSL
jgi:hypothetical protein